MASSSSATSLAAALGAPPTQLLTRENALVWKALVVPALRGACVLELVEGCDEAPVKLLETEDVNKKKVTVQNPEYTSWIARDQQVLRWLLNALSPDVLAHVLGMGSSAEAWTAINSHVSGASKTRIQHLRTALVETKKKDMSAEKYFAKMKTIALELASAGKPLEDDEIVWYKPSIACTRMKIPVSPRLPMLLAVEVVRPPVVRIGGRMIVGVRMIAGVMIVHVVVMMMIVAGSRSIVDAMMTVVVMIVDIVDVMEVATVVAIKAVVRMMIVHVGTGVIMVEGVAVVIGAPLPLLTPLVRFVTYMGILQKTVGGAMEMINAIMETVETKVPTLLLMELTQIGTMILAPLTTSPDN
ncbi:hypothetical protein QYE76_039106 [Lolium multiflorum]|uniref:Uncharacterized protein n=1 Tax=Lolium multiflorum TaxID=4521 RepID=A0AAD8WU57_LOLMU|nr:hypothetical protein QYE76_039106 [Lolium multiflorum]